jgi:hypothetical protein
VFKEVVDFLSPPPQPNLKTCTQPPKFLLLKLIFLK